MLLEYGIDELDSCDQSERTEILQKQPYSIIVEGDYMEIENLEKWINLNIGENQAKLLYYRKSGYDFGFVEFFFADSNWASKTAVVVSHIYTIYPHSLTPHIASKSEGYEKIIQYDISDKRAIVIKPKDS